jgi:hypothetical protein
VPTIELEASFGRFRLTTNEAGWCQVELQLADRRVALGADSLTTVIARLADGLGDAFVGGVAGTIDGVAVYWIVSFFEQHCTIYAADVENGRRLFVEDRDAKLVAGMTLSQEERLRWRAELRMRA